MAVETVSLCVIAYNEELFLPGLLHDLANQTYPHYKTEIVLVDGISSDRTKQIMLEFAQENRDDFLAVKVVDNPKRIQAAGWNVALLAASGDVIIRIDAHTHIPPKFTAQNMHNLQGGEYVSGGVRPCLCEGVSPWSKMLLEAENSMWGSSFNISRRGTERQYVKTMFHAAYRREVFATAGGFNENLLRTEDNEMHYRIRQAGYHFCFDPEIISYQYARSNLKKMLRQKYGNGYWIGLTLGVCPGCISLFHLVPLAFLVGVIFTTVLTMLGFPHLAVLMWTAYGLFTVIGSAVTVCKGNGNRWTVMMPLIFLSLHLSYGIGTLVGLIQMPSKRKQLAVCEKVEVVREKFGRVPVLSVDMA